MRKVIIIEDDAAILDVINLIFTRAGFNTAAYLNGNFLLNGDFEIPDLFIIDKQLSGVDGLELCRHLKGAALTKHVPVIILSATPHLHAMIIQAGADAFLEKPFSNQHLLQIANKLIIISPGLP